MRHTKGFSNIMRDMRNALKTEANLSSFVGREFTRSDFKSVADYSGYSLNALRSHGVIEVVRAESISMRLFNKAGQKVMSESEFNRLPAEIQNCLLKNDYVLRAEEVPTDYWKRKSNGCDSCRFIYRINENAFKRFTHDAKNHVQDKQICLKAKIERAQKRLNKIMEMVDEM